MVDPRAALAALVLLAVPLAGCLGFEPAQATCTGQHAYADRLVFSQEDLYAALGDASEAANASSEATWSGNPQGAWNGTRGHVETVRLDGRVHGSYVASPSEDVSLRVHDSALAGYGSLWLDRVTWTPNGSAGADDAITYHAPAGPQGPHVLQMSFHTANTSETEAAGYVATLHEALFPELDYDPLADETFSRAWLETYELTREGPVHADGLLTSLIDAGTLQHRQAPFQGLAFPHTLGTLHLQGEDVGAYDGEIRLRLGHDVRAIALGNDPTLALEVTPADRAYLSNLGSAPLGADELNERAQAFARIDGVPTLALAEASYEEGGQATGQTVGDCSPMAALGDEVGAASS